MAHPYDHFAPHFDAWQRAFGPPYDDLILPRLVAALGRHGPAARRLADLGVGTGDLVVALARRGYAMVAVDRSAPMLAVARAKAAAAGLAVPPSFVEQDIRALRIVPPVDAAICVYTVMNQLTGDGDLDRALAAVRDALVGRGLFLFELNLPASYARYWVGTETVRAGDATIVRTHRAVPGTPVIEAHVTIQRTSSGQLEEVYDRIEQRPYTNAEVEAALARTGFALLERDVFDPFDAGAEPTKSLWIVRRS